MDDIGITVVWRWNEAQGWLLTALLADGLTSGQRQCIGEMLDVLCTEMDEVLGIPGEDASDYLGEHGRDDGYADFRRDTLHAAWSAKKVSK